MRHSSCPPWCVADHGKTSAPDRRTWDSHYGATRSVAISVPHSGSTAERFEVGAVCCDYEAAGRAWVVEVVEMAHHRGNRYSVVALTPREARELAAVLVEAADRCSAAGAPVPLQATY